ncbi:unnamed protein product [Cylindrotheca closterium]|uniref:Uncharacterized protein n=1 Tax=Cylindrotheca closterium TaxID=2856 RepID=A0AAD2PUG6_9STRA|nr:unnamed protein product [Cylindrotheca closterium]
MNSPKHASSLATPPSTPGTPHVDSASLASSKSPPAWNSRCRKTDQKSKNRTAIFNTMNLHQACKSSKFNVKVLSNTTGKPPRRLLRRHKQFTYWNQVSMLTDDCEEPESDRCERVYHA